MEVENYITKPETNKAEFQSLEELGSKFPEQDN